MDPKHDSPGFRSYLAEHMRLDALKIPRHAGTTWFSLQARLYMEKAPPKEWRLFVVMAGSHDYPRHIAVRVWLGGLPGDVELFDTIEEARDWIKAGYETEDGLKRSDPSEGDDKCIVETWQ